MSKIWNDLRFAARTLRQKPVFTLVAIGSLGLGIGANTAIFSVVESALLRGLPFRQSDQLIVLRDKQPCCDTASISPGEYLEYKTQTKTLNGLAAYTGQEVSWTGGAEARKLNGTAVTTNFFDVLGAQAERGRCMTAAIDKPGETRVAVISHGLWESAFGSDPNITSRTVVLNGRSFRVIGVIAEREAYPKGTEVWLSPHLAVPEYVEGQRHDQGFDVLKQYGNHYMVGLGRLRDDSGLAQARAEMVAIGANIAAVHPDQKDHHAVIFNLQDTMVHSLRPALWVLLAAVVLLLLIACANLAGLLLARSIGRRREFAVRFSLGATRTEIIRLLLSESLLLALGGGVLGIGLAEAGLRAIAHYSPYDLPAALLPELNVPVLGFCIVVTLLSAVISGIVPALESAQIDVNEGLKEGVKGSVNAGTRRLRLLLVASEVAFSLMLLIGAGLLIRSFSNLISVHPGFDAKKVVSAQIALPETRYSHEQGNQFWASLLTRLRQQPELEASGLMSNTPFSGNDSESYLQIEGRAYGTGQQGTYVKQFGISSDTFAALRLNLLEGRSVNDRDGERSPIVAVVNKHFADEVFPHQSAVGKRFKGGPVDEGWATIVGVVSDFKSSGLDDQPEFDVFFNYPQYGMSGTGLVLRAKPGIVLEPRDLRALVSGLDRDVPLSDIKPLDDYIGASISARRFLLGLLETFAGLAILLAAMGLYAVLAFSVQQRRQEIGIRLALGAQNADVLWLVLRECLAIAGVGIAAGVAGSLASASLLRSMVFQISTTDIASYAFAIFLILIVAAVAAMIPSLRAVRVDPISALRYE